MVSNLTKASSVVLLSGASDQKTFLCILLESNGEQPVLSILLGLNNLTSFASVILLVHGPSLLGNRS